MSLVAIEINDANLTVADASGVLVSEPGYALLDRGRISTGAAAQQQARLRPRQVSSRYWSTLSAEPGSAGIDADYSAADLAFAQLDSLWRQADRTAAEVLLVVPGHYRAEQLGLLLGLAQECGMKVRALVDVAAAASVSPFPGHQLVHVDAGLHRVSATALEQGSEVAVRSHEVLASAGIASITDQLAHRIAEIFVLATRFDPFHHAESEQTLYDRLPGWLQQLHSAEQAELTLPYGGEELRVTVEREQLLGVAQGFYRAVVQLIAQHRDPGQSLVVQLPAKFAALPGFIGELARLDEAHIETLPAAHAVQAALLGVDAIAGSGTEVKLVKHLPWRAPSREVHIAPARRAAQPALAKSEPPTHVVHDGVAYRVGAAGMLVGREAVAGRRSIVVEGQSGVSREHCEVVFRDGELRLKDLSRYGTFVNEKRISAETVLQRGDVIRVGSPGAQITAVGLESADAA